MSAKHLFKNGFVLAVALIVAALTVMRFAEVPETKWSEFEDRISVLFTESKLNLNVLAVTTEEAESVPLPFLHRWRSAVWGRGPGGHVDTGFSDSVSHWTIKQIQGPVLHCLARYHEGKVACVVIRSVNRAEKQAQALRDEIAATFPHLKVTLEEICEPVGSGAPF